MKRYNLEDIQKYVAPKRQKTGIKQVGDAKDS